MAEQSPEISSEIVFTKNFVKMEDGWEEMNQEEFTSLTLSQIIAMQFVLQVRFGGQNWYVCTHTSDGEKLRRKYPNEKIVCLSSIIGMFTPESVGIDMGIEDFTKMLELISIMPAKFIDMRN